MTIEAQRQAVVAEAREWIGTPYHSAGRVKGRDGGADCLTLIILVYANAGIIPMFTVPHYAPDWHLHRNEQRYMEGVLGHCVEIDGPPLPGDLALWQFGRCFAHGGVVTNWTHVIHAYVGRRVNEDDADRQVELKWWGESPTRGARRPVKFFRPKLWVE